MKICHAAPPVRRKVRVQIKERLWGVEPATTPIVQVGPSKRSAGHEPAHCVERMI
jgi:hypothetical protein